MGARRRGGDGTDGADDETFWPSRDDADGFARVFVASGNENENARRVRGARDGARAERRRKKRFGPAGVCEENRRRRRRESNPRSRGSRAGERGAGRDVVAPGHGDAA
jgi:hypothetical protein